MKTQTEAPAKPAITWQSLWDEFVSMNPEPDNCLHLARNAQLIEIKVRALELYSTFCPKAEQLLVLFENVENQCIAKLIAQELLRRFPGKDTALAIIGKDWSDKADAVDHLITLDVSAEVLESMLLMNIQCESRQRVCTVLMSKNPGPAALLQVLELGMDAMPLKAASLLLALPDRCTPEVLSRILWMAPELEPQVWTQYHACFGIEALKAIVMQKLSHAREAGELLLQRGTAQDASTVFRYIPALREQAWKVMDLKAVSASEAQGLYKVAPEFTSRITPLIREPERTRSDVVAALIHCTQIRT